MELTGNRDTLNHLHKISQPTLEFRPLAELVCQLRATLCEQALAAEMPMVSSSILGSENMKILPRFAMQSADLQD